MKGNNLTKGVIPGIMAGYLFLAYAGGGMQEMVGGMIDADDFVVGGLIYGVLWWVVGGNFIMPLIAGGDVFQFGLGTSFYGHIIFGHALAFLVILRDMALKSE